GPRARPDGVDESVTTGRDWEAKRSPADLESGFSSPRRDDPGAAAVSSLRPPQSSVPAASSLNAIPNRGPRPNSLDSSINPGAGAPSARRRELSAIEPPYPSGSPDPTFRPLDRVASARSRAVTDPSPLTSTFSGVSPGSVECPIAAATAVRS